MLQGQEGAVLAELEASCRAGARSGVTYTIGFFIPTREGPCGPVLHRCSGMAVPPEPYSRMPLRGFPFLPREKPGGTGDADLSQRGREARVPFHLVVWLEPGEDRRV